MASQTLTDADFSAPAGGTLTDSDFETPVPPSVGAAPVPQATTYIEDQDTVLGHPADMSHDQVNDAVQTEIYGRPRNDFHEDAPPVSNRILNVFKNTVGMTLGMGDTMSVADAKTLVPEAGKGIVRGFENIGVGVAGLSKWLGEGVVKTGYAEQVGQKMADMSQSAIDWLHKRQTLGFEAPDPEIFRGSFVSNPSFSRLSANVAAGAPILAAATAVTIASANPVAGAGMLGLISAGEQYEASDSQGSSFARSSGAAAVSGIGNALLMSLPLGKYLSGFGKTTGEAIAKGATEFAGISAVLTPFNNIVARFGGDRSRQLFDGMAESVLAGAVSGGILGGFSPGRGAEIDNMIKEAHKEGVAAKDIDAARTEIAKQMTEHPEIIEKVIEDVKGEVQKVKPEEATYENTSRKNLSLGDNVKIKVFRNINDDVPMTDVQGRIVKIVRNKEGETVSGMKVSGAIEQINEGDSIQIHVETPDGIKIINTNKVQDIAGNLDIKVQSKSGESVKVKPEEVKLPEENVPTSEVVPTPMQMEELTKNTISEFRVGQDDAQGLDISKLIIEGKPQKDIYDRAKALADAANIPHVEAKAIKDKILSDVGKFHLDPKSDIYEEVRNSGISKEFFTTKNLVDEKGVSVRAKSFDEFAQQVRDAVPEVGPNASSSDVLDFLKSLETKRQHINDFIGEAQTQVVGEMQGQMFSRVQPGIKKAIREKTGQIRDLGTTVDSIQAFKESLKQQEKAANAATKMTREEIITAQTGLVGMLEKSGLELNDRAKFIRTVKNIQTQEQLAKALPEIQDRVGRLYEQASVRSLKSKVENELDRSKVKKQSGKPAGKFTADIQEVLDSFRSATKMTREEASQKINDNLEKYTNGFPPEEVVMENKILSMAGGVDGMNSAELQTLLEHVQDVKKAGRILKELKNTQRHEYLDDAVKKFVSDIAGEKGLDKSAAATGIKESSRNEGIVNKIMHTGNSMVDAWNSLLNIITSKSKSKAGEDFVSKFGDVMKETLAEKQGRRVHNEKLAEMVNTSYGVDEKGALKQLRENGKVESIGKFKNANDVEVDLKMSKDQAIKKWMELQDPTLMETFTSKDGMAWTPDMIAAVDKFLTPADKVFANAHLDFYRQYYERVNNVYRELYGANLPFNENYSPIRRSGIGNKSFDGLGEFLNEAQYRRSVSTGSIKSRVKNMQPLEFSGASSVLQQHISEMERFINWSNKVRDLYAVFGDPNVKQAIYENSDRSTYRLILDHLDDFARGGVHESKKIAILDKMRVNFTKAVIGIKPSIAAKQAIQSLGYLEHLTPRELASGMIDFFKDPKKNAATLMESEFLRSRGENIDRDIKDAIQSEEYSAFRKNQGFINSLMLNLRLGDKAAIMSGGWGVYKKAIAEGKTHEQALLEFAEVSNRTQQSGDLSEQNKLQRSGSLGKLATMFSSQPIQYLQREMWALRNGLNGRMSPIEAAKMFTLYHFVLPMTFQYVSDFFQFDPKKQARAAALGSLNEMFIVKDIVEAVVDKALDIKDYGAEVPLLSIKNDFKKAMFSIDWKNITNEDAEKAFEGILGVTSKSTGIPVDTGFGMIKGLKKIYDEEYKQGIGGLLGWPKSVLNTSEGAVEI